MAIRLLLCDSHAVFVESLALVLGEAGYHVVAVTRSPEDMLAALREQPADVSILDVSCLPPDRIDGIARLRAAAPQIGIVLLFAERDPELEAAAAALDIREFVAKTQRVADIIETIERIHGGDSAAPSRAQRMPRLLAGPGSDVHRLARYLTPREREVLCRLVGGADTNGVARAMGVTPTTARSHIQSVLKKLGAHSRVEATAAAVRHGLVDARTGEWLLG
jgi:two-component system nitrate/nitrite response regulator NarL